MAAHIGDSAVSAAALGRIIEGYKPPADLCQPRSATSAAALVSQAFPLVVAWPLKRILTWFLFAFMIHILHAQHLLQDIHSPGNAYIVFMMSILITMIARQLVSPLIGLAAKWLIIGRTHPGAYPLWGGYYLRRMAAFQLLKIFGRGFFEWHGSLLPWYYKLGGAKIGCGVKLHPSAQLSDFDLITIGDDASIDAALVRHNPLLLFANSIL